MKTSERKEFMDALATNYISEKVNSQVHGREQSREYYIALGKLSGACMALKLDYTETDKDLTIFTIERRNFITKVNKA